MTNGSDSIPQHECLLRHGLHLAEGSHATEREHDVQLIWSRRDFRARLYGFHRPREAEVVAVQILNDGVHEMAVGAGVLNFAKSNRAISTGTRRYGDVRLRATHNAVCDALWKIFQNVSQSTGTVRPRALGQNREHGRRYGYAFEISGVSPEF